MDSFSSYFDPELADVLSRIISQVRDSLPAVRLVFGYDDYERICLFPAPRLFQRRVNAEDGAFAHSTILKMLALTRNARGAAPEADDVSGIRGEPGCRCGNENRPGPRMTGSVWPLVSDSTRVDLR